MTLNYSKFCNLVLIFTLFSCAFISFTIFRTDIVTVLPKNLVHQWEKHLKPFSYQQAIQMIKRLDDSTKIQDHNLLKAKILEHLAKNTNEPIKREKFYIQAKKHYFSNTIIEPTKAINWAKIAYINNLYFKKNKQEKVLSNLFLAIKLGPYEPKNQRVIMPLIFKYWSDIKENKDILIITKSIIKHCLTYKINADIIYRSAKKYNVIIPLITLKKPTNA